MTTSTNEATANSAKSRARLGIRVRNSDAGQRRRHYPGASQRTRTVPLAPPSGCTTSLR
jgi:hypothetical protein